MPGRKTLVIVAAAVLLLAGIVILATGILSLPRASGPGTDLAPVTTIPTIVPTAATTEPTAIPVATPAPISFVPGPTQVPPDNLQISLEVNRDPQTKIVSVQYMGGRGQNGVKNVSVRLTRSDGQVLTGSFKPVQIGSGTELQGTEKTDRIEITVNYYTGDEYKVMDQVFEYKIRNA